MKPGKLCAKMKNGKKRRNEQRHTGKWQAHNIERNVNLRRRRRRDDRIGNSRSTHHVYGMPTCVCVWVNAGAIPDFSLLRNVKLKMKWKFLATPIRTRCISDANICVCVRWVRPKLENRKTTHVSLHCISPRCHLYLCAVELPSE